MPLTSISFWLEVLHHFGHSHTNFGLQTRISLKQVNKQKKNHSNNKSNQQLVNPESNWISVRSKLQILNLYIRNWGKRLVCTWFMRVWVCVYGGRGLLLGNGRSSPASWSGRCGWVGCRREARRTAPIKNAKQTEQRAATLSEDLS